ncbi:MAG TPA: DUF1800 domain-containing protein [Gemmataceae bacterium]|nr:DUF1800 domain-containing protein [Gemmataceae bacterium]
MVHLHRGAGFAATWEELQRDLKDGLGPAVERLLTGKSRSRGVPDDFADNSARLARLAVAGRDLGRLKAWWVYRMLLGPDPLAERMTLFWHNHFATSAAKVRTAVYRQNEVFREFGRGPFGELLRRAVKDPALLLYLDAPSNRKGHPNENLARELMELFTLGIGHYTETDVKEAARTLTGWGVAEGTFQDDPGQHDGGEKTVLGRTGRWTGDDLVKMLLDHPATADRLAARLCEHFMGEGAVDAAAVRALADGLRERNLDIGWAVGTVLRSQAFFAEANLGTRILGPAEYVVGAARALELFDPPPSTLVLAEFVAHLGQDLFHPPNVGGWPGGRDWLSARGAVGRSNYAVALLEGEPVGRPAFDPVPLARRHGRAADLETAVSFHAELLLGSTPAPAWHERLLAALGPKPSLTTPTLRRAVQLILASPDAQLA